MSDKKCKIVVKHGKVKNMAHQFLKYECHTKIVIVSDDIVSNLYLSELVDSLEKIGFRVYTFVFTAGEKSKTLSTAIKIYNFLSENNITRSDVIVALGGGVVGDVTGFVASTYMRGINFVQVPTTLIAQTDASVGGKNAVNTPSGKNIVGTFYNPDQILINPTFLETLPEREFVSGMSEVIKYGAICDTNLFYELLESGFKDEMILKCVKIKMSIVEKDEHDKSFRMILNFGHTIGHAIEKLSGYLVSHGEAIAVGMALITQKSELNGMTASGTAERITDILKKFNLPYSTNLDIDKVCDQISFDKKIFGNEINAVVLKNIGDAQIKKFDLKEFFNFIKC